MGKVGDGHITIENVIMFIGLHMVRLSVVVTSRTLNT